MPTIGNLPGADCPVTWPDGRTTTVNMIRLLVQTQNAEWKAKYDAFMPGLNKLRPTVKALREEYPALTCTTWEEAAVQMRQLHTALTEHIRECREAQA
jgi:hypothetical protein